MTYALYMFIFVLSGLSGLTTIEPVKIGTFSNIDTCTSAEKFNDKQVEDEDKEGPKRVVVAFKCLKVR